MRRNIFVTGKKRGQAMVEFAIVLPLLLLLLFGILETGRFLFIYSSVVTASRQAARYGAATGDGLSGVPRFGDCAGMRNAAQRVDFLNSFDDTDIVIYYDTGPGTTQFPMCGGDPVSNPPPATDSFRPTGSRYRLVVTIYGDYIPLVPKIVPFLARTADNGNAIETTSSRTILASVPIGMPPGGGGGGGGTDTSTVTITSHTPDPSAPGENVTVTVTVTGASGTPTGTVTITGAGTNCTAGLLNGTGSCDVQFNSIGIKTITAAYGGDSTYATSTTTAQHTVGNPTTTTITTHTPDPSLPGETVAVAVTVTGGTTPPSGDVTITGADSSCTITLNSSGAGNCDVVFNSGGVKTLTASYAGDSSHDPSTGTATHRVLDTSTTTITSDTPDPSSISDSVSVSVTVTGSATTPTGTVSLSGADSSCTITLSGGAGSCSVVFSSAGTRTLTATYSGDAGHSASTDTETHEVQTDPVVSSNLTIGSHTPNPSAPGETVAVTVTITGGSTTPTGTVTITGAETNCTITLNNGTGSCNVVFNNAGTRTITALYNGDSTHSTSVSTASHQVVASNTTTITSHTPNPSVPGANVAVAVTVAGGTTTPTGTVSITGADTNCTITLNNGSGTCNVVFNSIGAKTLTAAYNGDASHSPSVGTATHQVEAPQSGLQLEITPNPATYSSADQWISYSYQVTNTGNVTLNGLAITASRVTTEITCISATLTAGASTTCSGPYLTTSADAAASSFVNTATASASDGSTTVTSNTATATVSKVTATCAAAQQTITANADAWVDESDPGSTISSTTLTVKSRQNGNNARAYVNFAFPALPAGCTIQSVVLNLYASSTESGRTIQVWQVTSSWLESTISWNVQPSVTSTNAASAASGSTAGTRSWNVTNIVQNMYSAGNFYGFLVRDQSEGAGGNGFIQVYHSEDNSTNKPTLVITFGQAP